MTKTFNFGKIDYNNTGRKVNLVTIKVDFDGNRFSASGNVWNSKQTNCLYCGQNLDTLYDYWHNNGLLLKIYSLWKKDNLNHQITGHTKQTSSLNSIKKTNTEEVYTWECEQLKKVGLLFDDLDGKPYQYGTGWLTNEIPNDVKEDINKLLEVA